MFDLQKIEGFDWDLGNAHKNQIKHNVSAQETEQVFANEPLLIQEDIKHSIDEKRWRALGITKSKRILHIAFTIRNNRIRVISARDTNEKEKNNYEKGKI